MTTVGENFKNCWIFGPSRCIKFNKKKKKKKKKKNIEFRVDDGRHFLEKKWQNRRNRGFQRLGIKRKVKIGAMLHGSGRWKVF
jgi:hypothetical protein